MIHPNLMPAAEELTSQTLYSNLSIGIKGSTPLAVLAACSRIDLNKPTGVTGCLESVRASSLPYQGQYSPHCAALHEIATAQAGKVIRSTNIARNVIVPLINEINDSCKQELAKREGENPINVNVIQMDLNPIYSADELDKLLAKFQLNTGDFINNNPAEVNAMTDGLTKEVFLTAVSTYNTEFNVLLKDLVDSISDEGFKYIFNGRPTRYQPSMVDFYRDHSLLLNFLWFNAIVSGKSEINLQDVFDINTRTSISRWVGNMGAQLFRTLSDFGNYYRSGNFVLRSELSSGRGSEMYVFIPNYIRWVNEKKGTAEALIAFNSINPNMNFNETERDNVAYWQGQFEHLYNKSSAKMFTLSNQVTEAVVRRVLTEYIKTEVEDPTLKGQMGNRLNEVMIELDYTGKDLDMFALKVIGRTMGDNKDALEILSLIDAIRRFNPELSIAAAAYQACTKIVAKWLVSQMTISKAEVTLNDVMY